MNELRASLPGVLGDIVRIAGMDAAQAIARAVGGTEIYLPPVPSPDHWLSQLVGVEKARDIADHFTCGVSGMRIEIPLGDAGFAASQRAKVDAMLRENRSERDIARATGYTTRGVRKRRAMMREAEDDRQSDLFQH